MIACWATHADHRQVTSARKGALDALVQWTTVSRVLLVSLWRVLIIHTIQSKQNPSLYSFLPTISILGYKFIVSVAVELQK